MLSVLSWFSFYSFLRWGVFLFFRGRRLFLFVLWVWRRWGLLCLFSFVEGLFWDKGWVRGVCGVYVGNVCKVYGIDSICGDNLGGFLLFFLVWECECMWASVICKYECLYVSVLVIVYKCECVYVSVSIVWVCKFGWVCVYEIMWLCVFVYVWVSVSVYVFYFFCIFGK